MRRHAYLARVRILGGNLSQWNFDRINGYNEWLDMNNPPFLNERVPMPAVPI